MTRKYSLDNGFFGFRIKEVYLAHVEDQVHIAVDLWPVMGSDAGTLVFMPRLSICGCPGHVEIGFPCAFASGVAVAGVGINYQEGFGRYPQIASVSVGRGRDARPRYR